MRSLRSLSTFGVIGACILADMVRDRFSLLVLPRCECGVSERLNFLWTTDGRRRKAGSEAEVRMELRLVWDRCMSAGTSSGPAPDDCLECWSNEVLGEGAPGESPSSTSCRSTWELARDTGRWAGCGRLPPIPSGRETMGPEGCRRRAPVESTRSSSIESSRSSIFTFQEGE